MTEFHTGEIVQVEWLDSASLRGWTTQIPDVGNPILSVGYVVDCTDAALTISTSLNDEGSFISPLAIPWKCIEKAEGLGCL